MKIEIRNGGEIHISGYVNGSLKLHPFRFALHG